MDNKTPSSDQGGKHIKKSSGTVKSTSSVGKHESGARAAGAKTASAGVKRTASAAKAGAKTPARTNAKKTASNTAKSSAPRKKSAAKKNTNLVPILALALAVMVAAGLLIWKLTGSKDDPVNGTEAAPAPGIVTSAFQPTPTATPHALADQNTILPQAQIDEPDDFIDEDDWDNADDGENGAEPSTLNLFAGDGELNGEDASGSLIVLEATPTPDPGPTAEPTATPKPTLTPKPVKLDHTYEIEVDKSKQVITVYTVGENGYYDLIVKQFICSTGHCDKVEDGWYKIGEKSRWKKMGNGSYAQFASRISGPYLFHSACYYEQKNSQLKVRYYENLGTNASSGCIRLTAGDAYWIYTNCPKGTPIHVITSGVRDEELLEALQPPALISQKYDPTDPEAPAKYQYKPEVEPTPDPTPVPGVTPAPTPSWTVHPTLKAWGYC